MHKDLTNYQEKHFQQFQDLKSSPVFDCPKTLLDVVFVGCPKALLLVVWVWVVGWPNTPVLVFWACPKILPDELCNPVGWLNIDPLCCDWPNVPPLPTLGWPKVEVWPNAEAVVCFDCCPKIDALPDCPKTLLGVVVCGCCPNGVELE